jgi:hypothetical protein
MSGSYRSALPPSAIAVRVVEVDIIVAGAVGTIVAGVVFTDSEPDGSEPV